MPLSPRTPSGAGSGYGLVMLLRMTALVTARSCSGVAERERDKLCAFVRLHPEQDRVLAFAARVGKAFANIRRRRHRFATDFQNDITDLEAMLRGNAAGIDG